MYLKNHVGIILTFFLPFYGLCPILEGKKKITAISKIFIAPPAAPPSTLLP